MRQWSKARWLGCVGAAAEWSEVRGGVDEPKKNMRDGWDDNNRRSE